MPQFGILSTYSPTVCGLATFSAALAESLTAKGVDVSVVRIADEETSTETAVVGELVNGDKTSAAATAELLNRGDIAATRSSKSWRRCVCRPSSSPTQCSKIQHRNNVRCSSE